MSPEHHAHVGSPALWIGFIGGVLLLLAIDLLVLNRKPHAVSMKEALGWSGFCFAIAVAFAVGLGIAFGRHAGFSFATGYAVEEALSIDNLFVFLLVMRAFHVPKTTRHRVLFWGVLGALVLRGAFVLLGTQLIAHLHVAMYAMGAVLVILGARMLSSDAASDDKPRRIVAWMHEKLHITDGYREGSFFVREGGAHADKWIATPLFAVLLGLELTDLVFAVDSVPAVLGVTRDPFIAFSSNALAILGLRSLFFVLASAIDRMRGLKMGLAVILTFIGTKMALEHFVKVPVVQSLAFVCVVLVLCVLGPLVYRRLPWGQSTGTTTT